MARRFLLVGYFHLKQCCVQFTVALFSAAMKDVLERKGVLSEVRAKLRSEVYKSLDGKVKLIISQRIQPLIVLGSACVLTWYGMANCENYNNYYTGTALGSPM